MTEGRAAISDFGLRTNRSKQRQRRGIEQTDTRRHLLLSEKRSFLWQRPIHWHGRKAESGKLKAEIGGRSDGLSETNPVNPV